MDAEQIKNDPYNITDKYKKIKFINNCNDNIEIFFMSDKNKYTNSIIQNSLSILPNKHKQFYFKKNKLLYYKIFKTKENYKNSKFSIEKYIFLIEKHIEKIYINYDEKNDVFFPNPNAFIKIKN